MGVPETDAPVSRATTRRQKAILIWVPGYSLDRCFVVAELGEGALSVHVPNHELIVITTARKLLSIE